MPLASWHQKFLTVDQEVAYIGGMNIKTTDWDTSEHRVFEARRMDFDASLADRLTVMDKMAVADFAPRKVKVTLAWPGATPAEVEESVCRRVEEAVQSISGVEEIIAEALDSVAIVTVEMRKGMTVWRLQKRVVDVIKLRGKSPKQPLCVQHREVRMISRGSCEWQMAMFANRCKGYPRKISHYSIRF